MKIEKRSGKYRIQKVINGKRHSITFDHRPTNKEIDDEIYKLKSADASTGTFEKCADAYIMSKSNVLSPATIRGYYCILRNAIPDHFKNTKIADIDQIYIQKIINEYSANHSPKSTRNAHGFISAVMRQYRPTLNINTTLPQKIKNKANMPSLNDVKKLLDASEGTDYHIALQLGCLGLRRSEVCALTIDDVDFDNNVIHINKALVPDGNQNYVIKTTKTTASTREIYITDEIAAEIKKNVKIYDGHPDAILKYMYRTQDELKIKRFRFHALRHFYVSYAHSLGMSDADLIASAGYSSDYVMKKIYRHEMNTKEEQKRIAHNIF